MNGEFRESAIRLWKLAHDPRYQRPLAGIAICWAGIIGFTLLAVIYADTSPKAAITAIAAAVLFTLLWFVMTGGRDDDE